MEKGNEKLVYTPEEARVLLGCSKSVIYESLRQNLIPYIKLGRKYLIPKHQFLVWLNGASPNIQSSNSEKR